MFNLVLVHPDIPHNAGAAGRLAVATGSRLHLIRPLGFSLDDKHVRRTGLDYWQDVEVNVWDTFDALRDAAGPDAGFWFLSTKAAHPVWKVAFRPGDYLVFGCETKGLPEAMVAGAGDRALRIPMKPGGVRSLNLSTAVAITLYEALRQQDPEWT
jgi:tRNA (cytidine/uridine-2'-O-)-methyltransferase